MTSLQSDGIYTSDEEGLFEEEGQEGGEPLLQEEGEEVRGGKVETGEEEEQEAY